MNLPAANCAPTGAPGLAKGTPTKDAEGPCSGRAGGESP